MKQVFIFSLPRSGSTLLQRVLMGHNKINSVSEPWIMLPQLYSLKIDGHLSEYSSKLSYNGINDFIERLPNKKDDYYESLRKFIDDLQSKLSSNNEIYFLDKTPRYYYIIDELRAVFPEAKFIFLFRSPEQIYSSMTKTWSNNRLKPFLGSYFDLTIGFQKLTEGYLKHKKDSIKVNYEHFVSNPEVELKKIMNYLELDYDSKMIKTFVNQDTKGSLGDPTGVIDYSKISNDSLNKWKGTFNTITRKKVVYNTINKINKESFIEQGYDKVAILKSIKSLQVKLSFKEFRDIYDYTTNFIIRKYHLNLLFGKAFKWTKKKFFS